MKSVNINSTIIEGYLKLLENLSSDNKLDLISKLTLSLKSESKEKKKRFFKAFGAWDSKESAEELIQNIRKSRVLNRKVEKF